MGRKNRESRQRRRLEQQLVAATAQFQNPGSRDAAVAPMHRAAMLVQHSKSSSFVGPLPPPEAMAGYGEIDPTLVNRIVTMAEKEQAHRHSGDVALQTMLIQEQKNQASTTKRGQFLGAGAFAIALGCTVLMVWKDQQIAATIFGALNIGSIVGLFLKSEATNKKALQADVVPSKEAAPPAQR